MVGDARHWRDQPFYAIPKQLQWQFIESLGEDKFVMQLGALHIKDRCPLMIPNLMVALSLHSETVHMCAIESTGHPEEACSLQSKFLNEVKCFHDNDWNAWNGQPLPDYS